MRKNVILLLVYRVFGMGLTFIVSVIIAREFGAKGAGLYYIFLSIVAGLSLVANFGNDKTIIKLASVFSAQDDFLRLKGVWLQFFLMSSVLSIVLSFFVLLSENLLLNSFFPSYLKSNIIEYICVSVFLMSIISLNGGFLRGQKRPVLSAFFENILLPGFTVLGLVVFAYSNQPFEGLQVIMSRVIAILLVFSFLLLIVWKSLFKYKATFFQYVFLIKESWPIFGVGLVAFLLQWSATFIIALYMSEADVGIYNIAWRLVLLVAMVNFVFNNINSPYFSIDYEMKNLAKLERRVRKTAAASSIAGGFFLLPLMVFAEPILSVFGSEFTEGVVILWVLAIGQFISMTCGSIGYLLMMTGFGYIQRNINIVILVFQLILLPFMVNEYGIVGASIVASCALAFSNLLSLVAAHSLLGIRVSPSYRILFQ